MPHPGIFLFAVALAGYWIYFVGSRGREMVTEGLVLFAGWKEADAERAGLYAGVILSVLAAYIVYRMMMQAQRDAQE